MPAELWAASKKHGAIVHNDPAHGAILAVGAIEEKPVAMNGQVTVRQRMRTTGSFDHRIIDGAMGAKFLQELKKILENPVQLLL